MINVVPAGGTIYRSVEIYKTIYFFYRQTRVSKTKFSRPYTRLLIIKKKIVL